MLIQTGDPSGTGWGGPGYAFENETHPELNFDSPGAVAMANFGSPNTNGSQFFITMVPLPDLNGQYTVFGRVVEGMNVIESLGPQDPTQNGPTGTAVRILSIKIDHK